MQFLVSLLYHYSCLSVCLSWQTRLNFMLQATVVTLKFVINLKKNVSVGILVCLSLSNVYDIVSSQSMDPYASKVYFQPFHRDWPESHLHDNPTLQKNQNLVVTGTPPQSILSIPTNSSRPSHQLIDYEDCLFLPVRWLREIVNKMIHQQWKVSCARHQFWVTNKDNLVNMLMRYPTVITQQPDGFYDSCFDTIIIEVLKLEPVAWVAAWLFSYWLT